MKFLRHAFVLALFALSSLATTGWAEVRISGADNEPGDLSDLEVDYVAGEILVGFRPGANGENARRQLGASEIKRFDRLRVRHWKLPRGLSVEKAIALLEKRPNVEYAEPNYLMHIDESSNSELFVNLWGLHNVGQADGTPDADIDAPEAWDVTGAYDAGDVIVAVLDTGIDPDHEEFTDNLWSDPDDGTYGRNFVDVNAEPIDDNGHGTHVAGTICADGANGPGVAGVVWSCQLMIVKLADAAGRLTLDAAIAAIQYASDNGADIINASWGGTDRSNSLKNAINAYGGLFVAAAGNRASSKAHYPAAYPAEHIISVAATDRNDELAAFSNYSDRLVDLGAPGVDILSSIPGNDYDWKSGTSMAAPHVTGVAAMVMSLLESATPLEVKAHILESVDPLPALHGLTVTGGRLNALAAVGGSEPEDPPETPPYPVEDLEAVASTESWDSIHLNWTATSDNDGSPVFAYDIRYSTAEDDLLYDWENASQVEGEPAPGSPGSAETMTVHGLQGNTAYHFAMLTIDQEATPSETISNIASATTGENPWLTEIVDEAPGALFFPSIAVHPSGASAMTYIFGGDAYYAIRETYDWSISTIGPEGSGASLAFDPATGHPAVSHRVGDSLVFQYFDDNAWLSEEVDSEASVDAYDTSLAFGPDGRPCIVYGNVTGRNKKQVLQLRFACRQYSGGWNTEALGPAGSARYRTLAFEGDGTPLVAYALDTDGDRREDSARLARFIDGSWEFEVVSESETAIFDLKMAYHALTGPLLVAHGYGPLRLYHETEAGWQTTVINDESEGNPDIAIDSTGMPWISYRNYAADPDELVMARPVDGTYAQWHLDTVDSAGIYDCSIAINHDDLPVIAYGDVEDRYLKYAELRP